YPAPPQLAPGAHGARIHPREGSPRAQPQGHHAGDPEEEARGLHGGVGQRQELARLRHALRGGPAPVRGVAVRVRAPIPRADGEAALRRDPRALAHHLHRAEGGLQQPALHGRDHHRDPRLPPRPLRRGGQAALHHLRAAGGQAERAADRRRAGQAPRRDQADAAGAPDRAAQGRAQGRPRRRAQARVDGVIRDLDEDIELDKKRKHDIAVVVDRLVVKKEDGSRRLIDSVETALKEGKGILHALTQLPRGGETQSIYSEHLSCPVDGISFPELAPHSFSFNNPLGMCHECNGLGTRPEMDPDLIVPDQNKSIKNGAVEPWTHALERQGGWTFRMIESLSQSFKVPLDKPWKELPRELRDLLLYGSGDETMSIRWSEGGRSG